MGSRLQLLGVVEIGRAATGARLDERLHPFGFVGKVGENPYLPGAQEQAARLTDQGVALARNGQLDQALACFRTALECRPGDAKALHNLGVALAEKGQLAEAAEKLRAALKRQPEYLDAHYNLGNILGQLKQTEEAIASYRRALRIKPDHAESLNNLGLILVLNGRPEEAVVFLKHALRLRPNFLEAANNLGLALTELGDFRAAADAFEQALRLDPRHAESHTNLGNNYHDEGRLDEALACYDLAQALWPNAPSPHWNRALALLRKGDYEQGWAEYEWRRKKPDSGIRPFPQSSWDGSPLEGRTILIHMEQGLGDMLQFIRYAPLVQERGGRVVVTCPENLLPLFSRCRGIDRLIVETGELPAFDVHAPLLSLPALLTTTLQTVPAEVPYLFANDELVQRWRRELAGLDGFKIGIAWQGNRRHRKDRYRSIPLVHFERLTRVPGVRLVSLQKGDGAEQLGECRRRFPVQELSGPFDEASGAFMDTAAVMKNLDLVITSDTATAHLAGGLGMPTWVALAKSADWRWLQGRSDSPWYPTMRLFRQEELGRWELVFEAMAHELARVVANPDIHGMVPVRLAAGELLDKVTILEIKAQRLADPARLRHVRAELEDLETARDHFLPRWRELHALIEELREVNGALWNVEDALRACERDGDFGPRFVELAQSVYRHNDRRAELKRELSERLGAAVFEQKSYAAYAATCTEKGQDGQP
jgi:tetratricopeptide (TPR) repeat protein